MSISIRWPIILGSILLVWGTHLIIAPYSYLMSERVLTRHASDIMQNISDLTLEQSHNHLNKARSAAHLAKQLLSSNVFQSSGEGTQSLERYFFDQLAVYPHLAGIYFGTQQGDFFYVSRNDSKIKDGFRTKIISHGDEGRKTEMIWRKGDFSSIGRELAPSDTYDPRTRPWFKRVMEAQQIVWTSPYIFFTSKKPGVTIAGPTYDKEGNLKGIVGVDIDIAELSSFIGRLRVGKSGRAFIINRNRDVIAYHDVSSLTTATAEGKGLRLTKVEELADPIAKAAFESVPWEREANGDFLIDRPISSNFELGGKSYMSMFTPFPGEKLPWVIGVYVPEDDYLGALKENRLINSVSTIFVTIMASLLALLLAKRIIVPIMNLQNEAKAIEENDLKAHFNTGSVFSELQETANSFTRMKQSLIGFKDALLEKEELYRTITKTANDAIVLIDEDQCVSYWNPAAQKIFGYSEEEVLGRNLHFALAPGQYHAAAQKGLGRFASDGSGAFVGRTVEVTAKNKTGKEFPIELSMARLAVGGRWHAAAIIRDVSERKRGEQVRKRLVRDLHDGIGGNLANIKLLSEMAKRDIKSEAALSTLNSISEVSDNCIAEIRNYMNVLDEKNPAGAMCSPSCASTAPRPLSPTR